jgi:hypothetical protein
MRALNRPISSLLTSLLLCLCALAASPSHSHPVADFAGQAGSGANEGASPLIAKVRRATERYKDVNVALAAGFVQGTPCVSGPDFGAMGVHFVLPARLQDGVLRVDQPQALIYEPLHGGALRLVGVEFIVFASVWESQHPAGGPPALDGHLLNFVGAPNRYGLPAFYELHVWAWERNPAGSFADWNTRVSCAQQSE